MRRTTGERARADAGGAVGAPRLLQPTDIADAVRAHSLSLSLSLSAFAAAAAPLDIAFLHSIWAATAASSRGITAPSPPPLLFFGPLPAASLRGGRGRSFVCPLCLVPSTPRRRRELHRERERARERRRAGADFAKNARAVAAAAAAAAVQFQT